MRRSLPFALLALLFAVPSEAALVRYDFEAEYFTYLFQSGDISQEPFPDRRQSDTFAVSGYFVVDTSQPDSLPGLPNASMRSFAIREFYMSELARPASLSEYNHAYFEFDSTGTYLELIVTLAGTEQDRFVKLRGSAPGTALTDDLPLSLRTWPYTLDVFVHDPAGPSGGFVTRTLTTSDARMTTRVVATVDGAGTLSLLACAMGGLALWRRRG